MQNKILMMFLGVMFSSTVLANNDWYITVPLGGKCLKSPSTPDQISEMDGIKIENYGLGSIEGTGYKVTYDGNERLYRYPLICVS